jgi:hypothetical protein
MCNNYRRIKTVLTFLILCLCIIPNLSALSGDNWEITLEANTDINVTTLTNIPERLYDIEYIEGFNNRPLFQIDLKLFHKPWLFHTEGSVLSLRPPIFVDANTLFSPMIKLAFLEYNDEFVYLSVGRRKQSIGISNHNLFVNRSMPFFDGINLSVGKETGFRFDSLVSASNLSRIHQSHSTPEFQSSPADVYGEYSKYFLYHALSYTGKTWYAMIGESAILANPKSVADLSVFPNIHNENSERANVGMEFQFAKLFNQKTLVYALFGIDDLPALPSHSSAEMLQKTPSALAAGIGLRWHAMLGDSFTFPSHDVDKGIHKNTHFGTMSGGLVISLDYIAASRWMYVRTNQHASSTRYFNGFQSFYNYLFNPEFVSKLDHYSVPFGMKYGGDSQLLVLNASYESKKYTISGELELLLQGKDGRARAENENYWGEAELSTDPTASTYSKNWITSGDIQPKLTTTIQVELGLNDWLSVYTGVSGTIATYLTPSVSFNLGAMVLL